MDGHLEILTEHCGTLKMSKAPRNLGSACQIFFWPKSLLMGIYMWEKVEKVFPFNVPGLQDPQRELLEGTNLGHFGANFSSVLHPKQVPMFPNPVQ